MSGAVRHDAISIPARTGNDFLPISISLLSLTAFAISRNGVSELPPTAWILPSTHSTIKAAAFMFPPVLF
jgi:hypothetical protein